MKIIDFHTHFFPEKVFSALWRWFDENAWPVNTSYRKYADDLVGILKSEGVARCVSLHYPHKKGMAGPLNAFAFDLHGKYPEFVIPFGSLHPDDDNKEEILLECFEKYNFGGIKIHCHVQRTAPDDPRMDALYRICGEREKIVLIHCGTGPHFKGDPSGGYGYDVTRITGARRFEKVLKKFPSVKFVVPHMGYEEIESFAGLLDDYPNLYLDTTMVLAGFFPVKIKPEWFYDHADKILFGTDFPHIPYEWKREKENIMSLGLGAELEEKIFYRNAQALLGL